MEKLTAKISGTGKLNAIIGGRGAKLGYTIEKGAAVRLEERTVVPSTETQTVTPSAGYGGMSVVTVSPIPQCYGLITYDGTKIIVS